MAKNPSSVVGVDLGRYSIKSVALQRKGANRFVLNNFAVRELEKYPESTDELAAELKLLFKEMGGAPKNCAIALSGGDSLIRIIEQPETPTEILRDAVRLNGMTLLNQNVKEFVLDCDAITAPIPGQTVRYLVCGLPRAQVTHLDEALQKGRKNCVQSVQLAPVCRFNAFEFANEKIFNEEAFLLFDIGDTSSSVIVGVKRELMLVRQIEYGSRMLLDALISCGAANSADAVRQLEENDVTAVAAARVSLTVVAREISSSIGFFEGRREELITKVFMSGTLARSKTLLRIMGEELQMPCESWDPFKACEIAVPNQRKPLLKEDFVRLTAACGAAAEALRGK